MSQLFYITISQEQADKLPESNAIASTPDCTEFYVCLQTAEELEILDKLVEIEPEVKKAYDQNAAVVHLSC